MGQVGEGGGGVEIGAVVDPVGPLNTRTVPVRSAKVNWSAMMWPQPPVFSSTIWIWACLAR